MHVLDDSQYEQMLLPPRAAIKKLEDDILKQVSIGLVEEQEEDSMHASAHDILVPAWHM